MKPAFFFAFFACTHLLAAAPIGLSSVDGDPSLLVKGVPSLRGFPTWETLQPSPGKWNIATADALLDQAKSNGTEIVGIFHQLAPWASSDNGSQAFPLVNRKAWSDYVAKLTDEFKSVTHWDVLNSYNSGPRQIQTPYHYVELLTAAYQSAKNSNQDAMLGFSLASYDLEFLDEALNSGAGGKFDYISLSPFHYAAGSDRQLATVLPTLRALLASHDLPQEMPVHITLTGADDDLPHAAALAQSLGFDRVFVQFAPALLATIPGDSPSAPPSYEGKDSAALTFGTPNVSTGIFQPDPSSTPWDEENKAARLPATEASPVFRTAFLVDPEFISPENKEVEITLKVGRVPSEGGLANPAGFTLTYESIHGIVTQQEWWPVQEGNEFAAKTYKLTDAAFTGKLGWNFRIDASGSGNDLLIREVVVKK